MTSINKTGISRFGNTQIIHGGDSAPFTGAQMPGHRDSGLLSDYGAGVGTRQWTLLGVGGTVVNADFWEAREPGLVRKVSLSSHCCHCSFLPGRILPLLDSEHFEGRAPVSFGFPLHSM